MQLNLRQRLHSIRSDNTPVERAYGESMRQKAGLDGGHSGARFHCPICSRWYRRFAPFGLRGRPNARCPGCGSLERHRFLWLYLRDTLYVHRRFRSILHVAPEACLRESLTGISGVRYLAIDRYDDDAQADQQDLTDLPYAADTFDLIICNHVLEHIGDDRKALAEIARVLTPRGRALLMVPIDRNRQKTYEDPTITSPSARLEAFGHPYHVRICGWDYAERIRESRFDVLEAHSTALAPHHRRINRINKTVLYDCTIAP
jgi:SAM-dependent methyltransferase